MFFILSKTLGLFSSPANIIILFALLSFCFRKEKLKKTMGWIAFILFIFFTNQAIYSFFISKWAYPLIPINKTDHYDVAIVLGGASRCEPLDTNRVFLNENAGDRIIHSIQLYKLGKVDKILFTSGSASLTGNKLAEADQAKKLFYTLGIPKEDLILENKSRSTFENALFSSEILKNSYPNKKYLLITNAMHMKRGLACFTKNGISCSPFPIDNEGAYDEKEWDMYIVPKVYVLRGWERFAHEILGYWAYQLKGYI